MSFYYHNTHDGVSFSGNLEREQCVFVSQSGEQCPVITYRLPLCKQHLQEQYHCEIKTSRIPSGGMGLFATGNIAKGSVVCPPYTGHLITHEERDRRYGASEYSLAPYALEIAKNCSVDAALRRCAASYINDARGSGAAANARYRLHAPSKTVEIIAVRDISAGEEITVTYGPSYFLKKHDHLEYGTLKYRKQG